MAIFCGVVFLNLYLFFVSPPWMEDINHFVGGGKVNFQMMMYISIGNACFAAFIWWLMLKVCKHMVSKPLRAAGFSNFILTLHGSWVFIFILTALPAMSGSFISLMGITHGITQEYPLFLLNLLHPVPTRRSNRPGSCPSIPGSQSSHQVGIDFPLPPDPKRTLRCSCPEPSK